LRIASITPDLIDKIAFALSNAKGKNYTTKSEFVWEIY